MSRLTLRDPDEIGGGKRRHRADSEWHSLLRKARTKPGRWWEVSPAYDTPGGARSAAFEINSGRSKTLPDGRWYAVSRSRHHSGRGTVGVLFIQYMGD